MEKSVAVVVFVASLVAGSGVARAQTLDAVEVSPYGGYRFGGGFYELVTGQSVDLDGAVSFGVVLDIPFRNDLQIEGFFTHQEARFTLPASFDVQRTRWRVTVDHVQAGGLRELSQGRARPFLTGTLGLTRYASGGDNEVRFSIAAGGGVKLFPLERLGVRFDGRLYATLVDAEGDLLACAPGLGICVGSIDAWVVWQMEFTAGVVVRF
jgi:hypothetical protein